MPKQLTIQTPAFATNIFMGNEIALINASGTGNINIKKTSGKSAIRVIFLPKRKSDVPNISKNIENPDREKTYSIVPAI